ncbi:MAG: AsmA-like C-terminal region-containing protein, partial [Rhodospirillales bacterium]
KRDASKKDEDDTKIQLSADFKRVWLNERHWISKAEGRLTKDGGVWVSARLTGEIGKKEKNTFRMAIGPQKNGNRRLVVQADDAGETLKAFDLYENMLEGKLDVQAEYDDALPSRPIKGVMTVENYRIIKAPTLARLASVASIVGILENLNGKGLSFNSLELPFQLDDGLLTVKDASAKSISLGLTASGEISLKKDNVDIEGTFIPMYALNSVLSNIPVVGSIFSGGDKNGGVFAASYSLKGSVKDPKVGVNPLTVLAPGFLRNIFKIFKPGEPIPDSLVDEFFDQPSSL